MVDIYINLRERIKSLILDYDEAYRKINKLKIGLSSRVDIPPTNSPETSFLLNSIERKTNRKINTIKLESKKILISTNLQRQLDFIAYLEKESSKMIAESTAILNIKARSSTLPVLTKICIEEEKFLSYMIELLNKHIVHAKKIEKIENNNKKRTIKRK